MAIEKVEHIGIAVRNLEEANRIYEKLLNSPPYKLEDVASEKVKTSFFKSGPTKIELLETTDPEGPVGRFISRYGEGVHHIAFEVKDIKSEMKRLRKEGFLVLSEEPMKGVDNKLVCFLHPKNTSGVLIELCEEIG